jgi:hypothetical protein
MVVLLTIVLVTSPVAAVPMASSANLDPSCAITTDPFENASRISSRSIHLQGLCVNTARYRPIVNVVVDENRKMIVFNNYYYNQTFWKAEVPFGKGAISDVYFQVKKFTVLGYVRAAHVQIRYKMAKGQQIQLTHQVSGERVSVDDLAVSFEAALAKDRNFNVALAMMPMNPLVGRVGQTASILADSPRTLDQYQLDLDEEERRSLLISSLKRAQSIELNTFYGTLHPNCASEQFDLLDQLPRLKGKVTRFLVAASLDPVAGPTVEALRARNLIAKRIESFQDEVNGKHEVLAIDDDPQLLPNFIPTSPRVPWNLIVVSPDSKTLSTQDKEAVGELKRELLKFSLEALSSSTASQIFDPASLTSAALEELWGSLESGENQLDATITKFSNKISDTEHLIAIYFAPIAGTYAPTSLTQYGLDVIVPLPMVNVEYDASKTARKNKKGTEDVVRQVYEKIHDGTIQVARKGMDTNIPGYLLGVGIELHARKSGSTITIQSMLGINPLKNPMTKVNKQVHVKSLDIRAHQSPFEAPVALVSSTIPVPKPDFFFPKLKIDFGPIGKITDLNEVQKTSGLMNIWNPERGSPEAHGLGRSGICEFRSGSVPVLDGNLAEEASGIGVVDYFLQGRPVQFRVFSADVDLVSLAVEDIDVRADVLPLKCLSLEQVNAQFQKQANKDVRDMKRKMISLKIPLKIIKRLIVK